MSEETYEKFYKQNYNDDFIFLGQFTQESNKMIVSDPCYVYNPAKHKNIPNQINHLFVFNKVMRGDWNVWSYHWDNGAVCELVAIYCPFNISKHTDAVDYHFASRDWENAATVCVDSGQLGIYDFKHYRDDENLEDLKIWKEYKIQKDGDKWYAANCHISLNDDHAGIINNGCVASPCFGDGLYNIEVLKFEDKVAGVRLVFDDGGSDSDDDSE